MKLRLLLLCFVLLTSALAATASDIIALIDGTRIEGRVEEITSTVIKYRKASNLTGPLYTVEISSVSNIVYDNGSVDNFNPQQPVQDVPAIADQSQTTAPQNAFANSSTTNGERYMSDSELLILMNEESPDYLKKAKRCRLIGWIGAPVMGALLFYGSGMLLDDFNIGVCIGAGAAALWALGWNLRANYLKRQYNSDLYSINIISRDILTMGSNKLTAGLNVMGNRLTHEHTYGLSLALNF